MITSKGEKTVQVLVDTCVWSIALRHANSVNKSTKSLVAELTSLIHQNKVVIVGPIIQELLSGVKTSKQFNKLSSQLTTFNTMPVEADDYILAAQCYNTCRSKGVQGSHIDFLLCAIAMRNKLSIFTSDKDFDRYAKHLDLRLYGK